MTIVSTDFQCFCLLPLSWSELDPPQHPAQKHLTVTYTYTSISLRMYFGRLTLSLTSHCWALLGHWVSPWVTSHHAWHEDSVFRAESSVKAWEPISDFPLFWLPLPSIRRSVRHNEVAMLVFLNHFDFFVCDGTHRIYSLLCKARHFRSCE